MLFLYAQYCIRRSDLISSDRKPMECQSARKYVLFLPSKTFVNQDGLIIPFIVGTHLGMKQKFYDELQRGDSEQRI